MNLYTFDPDSGALTGTTVARPNPRVPGGWLIPRGATTIAPPATGADQIAVWGGAAWSVQPDLRDQPFWLPDGSEHRIEAIGVTPPPEALSEPPPIDHATAQTEALRNVDLYHAHYLTLATGSDTAAERDTWPVKAAAAQAILAASATAVQTGMIELEAVERELTTTELAQIIVDKASAYQQLVGVAGAIRAATRAAIRATTDPDQIAPILAQAQTDAEAAVAAAIQEASA